MRSRVHPRLRARCTRSYWRMVLAVVSRTSINEDSSTSINASRSSWGRRVGRPTGRNGYVVAIDVSNDEVGIRAATDTDDLYLLTIEGMMRMRDGHPSRNSWG